MTAITALSTTHLLADSAPDLWMALGRLHPLFLHFPIALAVVAALMECARFLRRRTGLSPHTLPLVYIAALGSIAAVITGWVFASYQYGEDASETLFLHRWIGISSAVLLSGLAVWGWKACDSLASNDPRRARGNFATLCFRAGVLGTAIVIGITGHLGGDLVYGEGFFFKALLGSSAPPASETTAGTLATAQSTPLNAEETAFMENVLPILSARCFECHGPNKQKGGLRLDSRAWLFSAQEEDWAVVPSKPDESALLERVMLPRDDPDAMPPKGEALTEPQIAALRAWIAAGAAYPASVGANTQQASGASSPGVSSGALHALGYAATIGVLPPIDEKVRVRAVAAAEALAARGVYVQPLAAGSPLYDVNASRVEPALTIADAALLHDVAPLIAHLNLANTAMTDDGLARIGQLPLVERLRLDHTTVGDSGVQALGVLPKLESVNLVATQVTPAIRAWLQQQPSLKRVYVWQSKISDEDAKLLALDQKFEVISGDLPLAQPSTPLLPAESAPTPPAPAAPVATP
ncbi:MAG: hypothetical protein EXS10_08525 [Phycisphaerales bacterium]|nr:hypothetical protein [Phycisphaerales bacterium]